jgi:hypothetical protein
MSIKGNIVSSEFITSLIVSGVVIIISIFLIIRGKYLRDIKSSSGLSASSNETSTGTALIIFGLLLLITQIIKFSAILF